MLDEARARVRAAGLANVELVEAGLLSYEHSGEPPEAVYSRNALHHLPDVWKAVAIERIARLLSRGGVFVLSDLVFSCDAGELNKVVRTWLEDAPADPMEGWTRADREQHLAEEYSTFAWLLEPMIERAGFEIVKSRFRAGIYALYICKKNA
jgi:ubiquinone/menaquinone biosynthesis C-methylase UbiE